MRKEVLFAILAGVVVGAVVAFGVWRANNALKVKESQTTTPSQTSEPEIEKPEFDITLASPEHLDVITDSPTVLSGITNQNVWIVISSFESDYIIKSNPQGSFEEEVELTGGVNEILITAFDDNGNPAEEALTIVYSTEFAKDEESSTLSYQEEATEEGDRLVEKVQQKIEEAKNQPKAYLGTITDISENTIQMNKFVSGEVNNTAGEIQQVQVGDDTTFVKVGKTTQAIEYSDVAIGDFIVAMGFVNEKGVLDAKRVLITSEPEPLTRKVVLGETLDVKKNELTLIQKAGGKELKVVPKDTVSVTSVKDGEASKVRYSDISEGSTIIVTGDFVTGDVDGSTIEARRIYIIATPEPSPTLTEEE